MMSMHTKMYTTPDKHFQEGYLLVWCMNLVHFLESHTRCVIMNGALITCFDALFADLSISHMNTDRTFQNMF